MDFQKSSFFSDTNVSATSLALAEKTIELVCSGGIAAIQVPEVVRALRRHGAQVKIFATEESLKFIGIESLRWASQNEVTIKPSGLAEHISTGDALVVFPATADIIAKARHGLCTDGATTLIQSALGMEKSVIFCPTMHDSLYASPLVQQNIADLLKIPGVVFTTSRAEEGKQKALEPMVLACVLVHHINKFLQPHPSKILLTFGASQAPLDPIRCITNLSTGDLGLHIFEYFYLMGHQLTIVAGQTKKTIPLYEGAEIHVLPDYQQMFSWFLSFDPTGYTHLIHLLAGVDFLAEPYQTKIDSQAEELQITLKRTKKILDLAKLQKIPERFAAKLTTSNKGEDRQKVLRLLEHQNLRGVLWTVAHDALFTQPHTHTAQLIAKNQKRIIETKLIGKRSMAQGIYDLFFLNSFENGEM